MNVDIRAMDPQSGIFSLTTGFKDMDVQTDVPKFLNLMSARWKNLPTGEGKPTKKKWRLFKNTSLITYHVRNAFAKLD